MVIHFFNNKAGVRFFKRISKSLPSKLKTTTYEGYRLKKDFLFTLKRREKNKDFVLITTHGSPGYLLLPTPREENAYKRYIAAEDLQGIQNDIIFAFSCETVLNFGQKLIDHGAVAYIGYDIQLPQTFTITGEWNIPRRLRKSVEMILKKILSENIAICVAKAINESMTVQELSSYFSFCLEKEIITFFNLSPDEVAERYNIIVNGRLWTAYSPILQIKQLEVIQDINTHMRCLGNSQCVITNIA